ncbi:MAG: thioredoxin domain-containing protein [Planctomycetota bacterium]
MELPQVAIDLQLTSEDHTRGPAGAPITLVEYGDYECPHCIATFPLVETLLETRGDDLRFVFRHFPLTSVHPQASFAAQAAEAAGAQDKFWPMHALLYQEPGGLTDDAFDRLAIKLNLEIYKFQSDLTTRRFADRVQRVAEQGKSLGVTGTPTLFVNGRRLSLIAEETPASLDDKVQRLAQA